MGDELDRLAEHTKERTRVCSLLNNVSMAQDAPRSLGRLGG